MTTETNGCREALKPCPFCGNEQTTIHQMPAIDISYYSVSCDVCNSWTDGKETRNEAIAAWNRRPAPATEAVGGLTDEEITVLADEHTHIEYGEDSCWPVTNTLEFARAVERSLNERVTCKPDDCETCGGSGFVSEPVNGVPIGEGAQIAP